MKPTNDEIKKFEDKLRNIQYNSNIINDFLNKKFKNNFLTGKMSPKDILVKLDSLILINLSIFDKLEDIVNNPEIEFESTKNQNMFYLDSEYSED